MDDNLLKMHIQNTSATSFLSGLLLKKKQLTFKSISRRTMLDNIKHHIKQYELKYVSYSFF